jgi:hypothetical protein
MAVEGSHVYSANRVVPLVCVLLHALFACFSCMSFDLGVYISRERTLKEVVTTETIKAAVP